MQFIIFLLQSKTVMICDSDDIVSRIPEKLEDQVPVDMINDNGEKVSGVIVCSLDGDGSSIIRKMERAVSRKRCGPKKLQIIFGSHINTLDGRLKIKPLDSISTGEDSEVEVGAKRKNLFLALLPPKFSKAPKLSCYKSPLKAFHPSFPKSHHQSSSFHHQSSSSQSSSSFAMPPHHQSSSSSSYIMPSSSPPLHYSASSQSSSSFAMPPHHQSTSQSSSSFTMPSSSPPLHHSASSQSSSSFVMPPHHQSSSQSSSSFTMPSSSSSRYTPNQPSSFTANEASTVLKYRAKLRSINEAAGVMPGTLEGNDSVLRPYCKF